jgi:hypothetical protein
MHPTVFHTAPAWIIRQPPPLVKPTEKGDPSGSQIVSIVPKPTKHRFGSHRETPLPSPTSIKLLWKQRSGRRAVQGKKF